MDTFFQTIGAVVFVAWLAGNLGAIDFRLCIDEPGKCSEPATQAERKEK